MRWVLGLNKYSHDAGCALLSCDGSHSIIVPNERLSRVKHDGGDTAAAVRHALDAVGATLDDVAVVCSNNHHHRIGPFERRLPWSVELGLYPPTALSDHNLLPGAHKHELSHHLAHAWSAIAQAPFDRGIVVVMDGMGETLGAMEQAELEGDERYMHDLKLDVHASFVATPARPLTGAAASIVHREAESAYVLSLIHI